MNISEHNQKVAIARWSKVLAKEKTRISNTQESAHMKAAICGFLAGDGSVSYRKYKSNIHAEVRFYPDDKEMLDAYCDAIRSVYGKELGIRKKGKIYHARLTSRTMVEDVRNLAEFGLYRWNLPYRLLSFKGAKESWLRAFFSSEAYVGPNHIKIQTVNRKGMKQVSELLNDLNINHKTYEYTPKNSAHSPVHIIVIGKKEARKRYLEKVGFWHSKKTDALKKSLGL